MVTETIFFCIVSLASWAYGNTQSMWKGDSLGGPRPPPPGTRIPSRWFAHQLGVRFQTHTAVSLIWKLRLMPGNFDYDQNNCVICIKPSFANDGKAISGGQQSLGEGRIPRQEKTNILSLSFFSGGVKLDFTIFVNDFRDSEGLPRRKAEMVSTHKKRKY